MKNFLLKTKQNLSEQNRSTKTYRDRPIQIALYLRLQKPNTDAHCSTSAKLPSKLISRKLELVKSWNYQNTRIGKNTYLY